MKKYLLLPMCLFFAIGSYAQKKNFSYKFYGQVRTDLFYNSRANDETVDGLFYMYPKKINLDANGKDLNASPNGSFYTLYSRLGLDVQGPQIGKAKTSAKMEVDFRGSGTSYSMLRIRHIYFNLNWDNSSLLLGQTWHPLFGDVSPQVLNLNTGAPYQPFSRTPQVRYRYSGKHFQLTGAAVWQAQYLSQGIDASSPAASKKSQEFIKNSCVPEFYLGADYKNSHWLAGAGVELLSLKPRTSSSVTDGGGQTLTYKVNERVTSLSYEAHAKYTSDNWFVGAKTVLGSNLTQTSTLGGFGIKSVDAATGEREYTPLRVSSTWLNIVYGKKWKPGLFLGYAKNLGAADKTQKDGNCFLYGTGTDVSQLATGTLELTYNLPHWKVGVEYSLNYAWYGKSYTEKGRPADTYSVKNHRAVFTAMFIF